MKLFSRHNDNEEKEYKKIFYTYYYRVYLYTAHKVKGRENVRDIAQNVFFHLWQFRSQLISQNPEGIIFNTCKQEVSKFLKSVERQPVKNSLTETDPVDDFDEQLHSKFEREQLYIDLEQSLDLIIPPLRRKIFKMNKLERITQEQIALLLNIPKSTIKHHISEAMLFLKNHHRTLK